MFIKHYIIYIFSNNQWSILHVQKMIEYMLYKSKNCKISEYHYSGHWFKWIPVYLFVEN